MDKLDKLLSLALKHARKDGFGDAELFYRAEESLAIKSFEGQIESLETSTYRGLAVRVIKDGRCGYSYSEALTLDAVAQALREASEHCRINPQEAGNRLKAAGDSYVRLGLYSDELARVPTDDKIAMAKRLELQTREQDGRIVNVPWAFYGDGSVHVRIATSQGLDLFYRANGAGLAVEAMARESDQVETYSKTVYSKTFGGLDPDGLARTAGKECIARLGAVEVKSGGYRVVFDNRPARSLLATFSGVFSAKNVQKGISLLAGKLGGKVAAGCVAIMDDALLEGGYASRPFDAEGSASRRTAVVSGGVLGSFLHNLATAAKDGVSSTGNASRPSIKSPLDIAPSNFYLAAGDCDRARLIEMAGAGVLVTELQGLHSGANPISGDFSLSAHGYELGGPGGPRPIRNFTVAGNFFELMKSIEAVGNDLEFSSPSPGGTSVGSPSLLAAGLSIGGI